jgi:predicted permease
MARPLTVEPPITREVAMRWSQSAGPRRAGWLSDLSQDIRYGLRALGQRLAFSTVVVGVLALGIAATTVIFSVVDGVLFTPLPYSQPERLVTVTEQAEKATPSGSLAGFSYPNFLETERASRTVALAAWRPGGGTVSSPGEPAYVSGALISSALLSVLGAVPAHGREFLPDEDRPGGPLVAMISHQFWQDRYAGSPSVVGSSLVFDNRSYAVVGVVPAGFRLSDAQVFTPLGQSPQPAMRNRAARPGILVLGRLRGSTSLAEAQAELGVIARRLADQYPASNTGRTIVAEQLRPNVGDVRTTVWLLLAAISIVLLIGCANIASLTLARSLSREHEFALRAALGASKNRLLRQCLTESAVLALCGGAFGVLLAALSMQPFVAFWPGGLPRAGEVQLDWRVLLFASLVSLGCGVLFGLAPALRVSVSRLEQTLRGGGRNVAARSRYLHSGFVVFQVGLAVVLLVSAGMLGRSLLRLSSLDPGLDVRNVLISRVALSPSALRTPQEIRARWDDVVAQAGRVPGVEAAALVDTVPMRQGNNQLGYWTTPAPPPPNEQPLALATSVTPAYLDVMRLRLLRGRFINERDDLRAPQVVVIDDVLARDAFGGDAVGKQLRIQGVGDATVVGVVGHVRHFGLANDDQADVRAQLYYPFAQVPDPLMRFFSTITSLAVRTTGDPLAAVGALRRDLRGATGDQVLYEVRTMEQLAGGTLAQQRFLLLLGGIFAGLALLLACIGIYGVLAYLTSQRTREFGVYMALGAHRGDVVRLVLRQALGIMLVGLAAGVPAALATGRLLDRLVSGMRSTEPLTFGVIVVAIVLCGLLAAFLPARRISRIDPVAALRQG